MRRNDVMWSNVNVNREQQIQNRVNCLICRPKILIEQFLPYCYNMFSKRIYLLFIFSVVLFFSSKSSLVLFDCVKIICRVSFIPVIDVLMSVRSYSELFARLLSSLVIELSLKLLFRLATVGMILLTTSRLNVHGVHYCFACTKWVIISAVLNIWQRNHKNITLIRLFRSISLCCASSI